MAIYEVRVLVTVPDEVDAGEYLDAVSFDCIHPEDGDIYDHVDGYQRVR